MYLNTIYKLKYPTVDDIMEELLRLGGVPYIYKIDLAGALRQLPIDPFDYNVLGLKWDGQYFADVFCPSGHCGGP